jgi:hypothetical protein
MPLLMLVLLWQDLQEGIQRTKCERYIRNIVSKNYLNVNTLKYNYDLTFKTNNKDTVSGYTLSGNSTKEIYEDFGGIIHVTVSDKDKKLFSFKLNEILNQHSSIRSLHNTLNNEIKEKMASSFQSIEDDKQDARSIAHVLIPKSTHRNTAFLYTLFPKSLADNNSKKEWLDILCSFKGKGVIQKTLEHPLNIMLKNILSTLSWEDEAVISSDFSVKYINEYLTYDIFKETFRNHLRSISIRNDYPQEEEIKSYLNAINNNLIDPSTINFFWFTENESDYIKEENFFSIFNKIKELNFVRSKFMFLKFTQDHEYLKKINASFSQKFLGITGFNHLKALEILDLQNTDLTRLNLNPENKALREIYLQKSSITELTCDKNNIALKTVNASWAEKLKKFTGFEQLSALEELNLSRTSIDFITFSENNKSLKNLNLSYLKIEKIDGIQYLSSLERMILGATKNLKTLNLVHLSALEEVSLEKSNIESLTFGPKNEALRKINLTDTKNLKTINLENLSSLENLNLKNSGVKSLTFGQKNKDLTEINLTGIEKLKINGFNHLSDNIKKQIEEQVKNVKFINAE